VAAEENMPGAISVRIKRSTSVALLLAGVVLVGAGLAVWEWPFTIPPHIDHVLTIVVAIVLGLLALVQMVDAFMEMRGVTRAQEGRVTTRESVIAGAAFIFAVLTSLLHVSALRIATLIGLGAALIAIGLSWSIGNSKLNDFVLFTCIAEVVLFSVALFVVGIHDVTLGAHRNDSGLSNDGGADVLAALVIAFFAWEQINP
jgi:hypothetical protein